MFWCGFQLGSEITSCFLHRGCQHTQRNKHFVEYLEGIEGAAEDEQAVVSQWGHHSQVGGVADEVDLADAGIVMDHLPGRGRKL